jgi:hypothetical protein
MTSRARRAATTADERLLLPDAHPLSSQDEPPDVVGIPAQGLAYGGELG